MTFSNEAKKLHEEVLESLPVADRKRDVDPLLLSVVMVDIMTHLYKLGSCGSWESLTWHLIKPLISLLGGKRIVLFLVGDRYGTPNEHRRYTSEQRSSANGKRSSNGHAPLPSLDPRDYPTPPRFPELRNLVSVQGWRANVLFYHIGRILDQYAIGELECLFEPKGCRLTPPFLLLTRFHDCEQENSAPQGKAWPCRTIRCKWSDSKNKRLCPAIFGNDTPFAGLGVAEGDTFLYNMARAILEPNTLQMVVEQSGRNDRAVEGPGGCLVLSADGDVHSLGILAAHCDPNTAVWVGQLSDKAATQMYQPASLYRLLRKRGCDPLVYVVCLLSATSDWNEAVLPYCTPSVLWRAYEKHYLNRAHPLELALSSKREDGMALPRFLDSLEEHGGTARIPLITYSDVGIFLPWPTVHLTAWYLFFEQARLTIPSQGHRLPITAHCDCEEGARECRQVVKPGARRVQRSVPFHLLMTRLLGTMEAFLYFLQELSPYHPNSKSMLGNPRSGFFVDKTTGLITAGVPDPLRQPDVFVSLFVE